MKNRTRRVIGWIAYESMTPMEAAERAIAKAKEVFGESPGVLHLDTVTGKLTLFADVDMPAPPGTFVRGVFYKSDPDVLADDLASETRQLFAGRPALRRAA